MIVHIPDEDVKLIRRVLWAAYCKSASEEISDAEAYSRLDDFFDNGKGFV